MAQEGKAVEEISFEKAYAAWGRAVDAYVALNEGHVPGKACPPLYIRAVAARLEVEEQKVPPALKEIMSMIMEGVDWLSNTGSDLPQSHVQEITDALAQAGKFLSDLTDFRASLVDVFPAVWERIHKEAQGTAVEPSGERVRVEMPPEVREELERLDRAAAQDDDIPSEEQEAADLGVTVEEFRQMKAAEQVTDEEYAAENAVPINGPGRYIGLPPEPEPMLTDMEDVPPLVSEGLEKLASAPDVFSPQVYVQVGDTAEMEPVTEDPASYVTLLDGVSTVSKQTVMEQAESRPAEKLARGDVIPTSGGLFFLVESHAVEYSDGSRLVRVVYTDGKKREWYPGTMVTAYRPE